VAGAVVDVLDVGGQPVTQVTLDAGGFAFLELGAGSYTLNGRAVEGLMDAPPPQSVTVADGTAVPIVLSYDTGIR
jgi:hypothetical protein